MLDQIENERDRFLIGNPIGNVDRRSVQVPGDAALPDSLCYGGAFGFEHAGGVVAVERRTERIRERDLDGAVVLFEGNADTRERSTGAYGADEPVDLAIGLVPDFRTGRLHVAVTVGHIVELIGPDRAVRLGLRQLFGQPAGDL